MEVAWKADKHCHQRWQLPPIATGLASNFQLIPHSTEKIYRACFKPQATKKGEEEEEGTISTPISDTYLLTAY